MDTHFALVTAPRRFGKTVNLKMLTAFLQAENGRITSNRTDSCNLFIKHNLNIFTWNNTFFHLHCGKYPVIYISFKKITGTSFNGFLDALRKEICESYVEHVYLHASNRLDDWEKKCISSYFKYYCNETSIHINTVDGVVHLSEMLHSHFNKKAIVLIDDVDALVWRLLARDFQGNYFQSYDIYKTIHFFKEFLLKFLEQNRPVSYTHLDVYKRQV